MCTFPWPCNTQCCCLMTSFVWIRIAPNVVCLTNRDSALVFLEPEMTLQEYCSEVDQGLYGLFLHRSLNISSYVLPIRALHRFLACGTQTSTFERNLSGFHRRVSTNIKLGVYCPLLITNTDSHIICINNLEAIMGIDRRSFIVVFCQF